MFWTMVGSVVVVANGGVLLSLMGIIDLRDSAVGQISIAVAVAFSSASGFIYYRYGPRTGTARQRTRRDGLHEVDTAVQRQGAPWLLAGFVFIFIGVALPLLAGTVSKVWSWAAFGIAMMLVLVGSLISTGRIRLGHAASSEPVGKDGSLAAGDVDDPQEVAGVASHTPKWIRVVVVVLSAAALVAGSLYFEPGMDGLFDSRPESGFIDATSFEERALHDENYQGELAMDPVAGARHVGPEIMVGDADRAMVYFNVTPDPLSGAVADVTVEVEQDGGWITLSSGIWWNGHQGALEWEGNASALRLTVEGEGRTEQTFDVALSFFQDFERVCRTYDDGRTECEDS